MEIVRSALLILAGLLQFISGSMGAGDTGARRDAWPTLDPRVREYVMPTRVLWQSPAEDCSVENAQQLLQPFSGQITLESKGTCMLRHKGKPPGLLLDFGRELHGGIQIAVADLSPSSKWSSPSPSSRRG